MRIHFVVLGALVAASLGVAPAMSLASAKASPPDTGTATFSPPGAPNNISDLLQEIHSQAVRVRYQADQLQMLVRNPLANWQDDGLILENVRGHVNQMNKLVSYLRMHEAEASPLQRKIIAQVAAPSLELADNTQDAIVTLKNHEAAVYMSDLPGLADDMYKEAGRIDRTVGNLDKYLGTRHEEQQLKQTLGL